MVDDGATLRIVLPTRPRLPLDSGDAAHIAKPFIRFRMCPSQPGAGRPGELRGREKWSKLGPGTDGRDDRRRPGNRDGKDQDGAARAQREGEACSLVLPKPWLTFFVGPSAKPTQTGDKKASCCLWQRVRHRVISWLHWVSTASHWAIIAGMGSGSAASFVGVQGGAGHDQRNMFHLRSECLSVA
jgi:hypothetical protein